MAIRTLVVDDNSTYLNLIAEILQKEGHEVNCVKNLTEARERLKNLNYHLALIDIVLDKEDGLDLLGDISKLNRNGNPICAPIIISGYATKERVIKALRQGAFYILERVEAKPEDFIVFKLGKKAKGFSDAELLDVVRNAIKKVLLERSRQYDHHKFSLFFHITPGQKTRIELTGPSGFVVESTKVLEIDIDEFSDRTDDLHFYFEEKDINQRTKWRSRANKIGEGLYKQVFKDDSELISCLFSARERSNKDPLHIIFRGTQDILRLPVELLPGETGYLVTEYPLTRQITGIKSVRNKGIESILDPDGNAIRVLLIGSNTSPSIPGVDQEIELLEKQLQILFRSRGLAHEIKVIPTHDASYDNVYSHLEQCQYHIVHYAGHGYHDENDTDESGLFFWEMADKCGNVKPMPVHILRNLMQKSDIRFFYLSCCVGAKTAGDHLVKLKGNDFQGIMEGLVRVGIPSVLGYRWNVWDGDALHFAQAFYDNLFTEFSPDIAAFKARRYLQETNYYNETWASPVLISQTS